MSTSSGSYGYPVQYLGPGGRAILHAPAPIEIRAPTIPESRKPPTSRQSGSRGPRPSYSDEQKFFIMWARIVCGFQWTTIKGHFERLWGGPCDARHVTRTEEGLTSVYYRVRNEWGLQPVQSGPPSEHDRQVVHRRAMYFSRDFLAAIGYLVYN